MGNVAEGFGYVGGTALIGAGLYLLMRGSFPSWWQRRFAWPLVRITPTISHLQGAAAIVLGASMIGIVFTNVAPVSVGGFLVIGALLAYGAAVALFLLSTWLSRRPTA